MTSIALHLTKMRYSLLSRFQGTLLGAALGEILGSYSQTRRQTRRSTLGLEGGQWIVEPSSATAGWGRIAVASAQELINGGETDWRYCAATLAGSASANCPTGTTGLAIAALPIALLFHENPEKLRHYLSKMMAHWGGDSDLYGSVLTVAYTIALALQERLYPSYLISQLLSDLDLPERYPNLANQLLQVRAGVEQGIGLSVAIERLESHFSIAFYCFLSTPEDYSLTIRRCAIGTTLATAVSDAIGTTAIAGALSGVYNSRTGIPLDWRGLLNHSTPDSPLAELWNLNSADQIDRIVSEMLAVWLGMYQPIDAASPLEMVSDPAKASTRAQPRVAAQYRALPIAAARVIRPR